MEQIELQDIITACEEADSVYIKLYRSLLGYEDNVNLYRGIDDSMEENLNAIEEKSGIAFPPDFLQIYLLSNGGKYFDINLFSLTNDKKDTNGLYYKNVSASLKEEFSIPNDMIIIGETKENEYLLIGIDDEGYYYYCMWDKETKEKGMDFESLVEVLVYEIDYHTQAFSVEEE